MKSQIQTILLSLLFIPVLHSAAQTPVLSSHPTASATLFLDFDGHSVVSTAWTGTYDELNLAPSGLSDAQVTEIFNRVAEDYRPFNINVTTDSTKFLAAPFDKRMRLIITTSNGWYPGVGGVAFVSSFIWGDDTPCFVFSAALEYNVKKISEAVSHEAGHTLNLYHQAVYNASCALVSSYNSGTGTGEIGWAPIMGVGYYQNFTLWNNGPNPYGCTQSQNDLHIITTYNGFDYRDDDHANTFDAATAAVLNNNQLDVSGIIERNTDQDIIKFSLPTEGKFTLNAVPYSVGANNAGSNLDMQITLYDAAENVVNTYNPGNTLNLVVDTVLEAGIYYAKIEGKGNLYAPAYASLGSYSLQATFTDQGAEPLPLRKLELKGSVNTNKHTLNWIVEADEKITYQSIEISTDGKTFSTLTEISSDSRSYTYIPTISATALYRINVVFDNGRQYYSNTISLRQLAEGTYKPAIIGNIISGSSLNVNSPGNYNFRVTDINGKNISSGIIKSGASSINTNAVMPGVYFISFSNGKEQWTDKFVKQ